MSSARADDTASHATENGKLYSTRFLTVAERFSVAVAQTKNDGVVEGKLPTPDRYSRPRLKRKPTSKNKGDSSLSLGIVSKPNVARYSINQTTSALPVFRSMVQAEPWY
jgi:hypothetical protein